MEAQREENILIRSELRENDKIHNAGNYDTMMSALLQMDYTTLIPVNNKAIVSHHNLSLEA
jgi:hypothetical protein